MKGEGIAAIVTGGVSRLSGEIAGMLASRGAIRMAPR